MEKLLPLTRKSNKMFSISRKIFFLKKLVHPNMINGFQQHKKSPEQKHAVSAT